MYHHKPTSICAICKIPYIFNPIYGDDHSICRECVGSQRIYRSVNNANNTRSHDCQNSVCISCERDIHHHRFVENPIYKSEEQTKSEHNKFCKLNCLNRTIPDNPKELFEKTVKGELRKVGFDPKIDYLRRAGLLEVSNAESGCNENGDNCTRCLDRSLDEVSDSIQTLYPPGKLINKSFEDVSKQNEFSIDSLLIPEQKSFYLEPNRHSQNKIFGTSVQDQEIHINSEKQKNNDKITEEKIQKKRKLLDSGAVCPCSSQNLKNETLSKDTGVRTENETSRIFNVQSNKSIQHVKNMDTKKTSSDSMTQTPEYVELSTQKLEKNQEDEHKNSEKQQKENNGNDFSVEKLINMLKTKSNATLQEVQRILFSFTSNRNKNNTDLSKDNDCTEADMDEKEAIKMNEKFKEELVSLQTFVDKKDYEGAYADFSNNSERIQIKGGQIQRSFDIDDRSVSQSYEISSFESKTSCFLHNIFVCPITRCEKIIFSSELIKHIQTLHPEIPFQKVSKDYQSIFFDLQIHNKNDNNNNNNNDNDNDSDADFSDKKNLHKCHYIFLLSGKIKNLGNNEYKNYLPILLMSTKIHSADLKDLIRQNNKKIEQKNVNNHKGNANSHDCYIIWLTGLTPLNDNVRYSIKLRINNFDTFLKRDGKLFSIQNAQKLNVLYRENHTIIITENQYNELTNYGKDLIECQVKFQ